MPSLVVRLVRAVLVFTSIFVSYLVQLGLAHVLQREVPNESGCHQAVSPDWVIRRRAKVDQRNAKRLLKGILRLRGVFIKMGQVLSIMGGFLPRVYARQLEALQDRVPPQRFEDVEKAFALSIGRSPQQCFSRIESTPLAAASLGQVHVAWLADGRKVAVKILYPGIRDVIAIDLRVLGWAIRVYQLFVPVRGIERAHDALVDLLHRETDYLHEAECMRRMASNFEDESDILIPSVVDELTTRDVLTMTYMEGLKVTHIDDMPAAGIDPRSVAVRLVESFYKQLFVDRFFHADPHPGNFLVQAGRRPRRPKIVVLDFGAVSEVQPRLVEGLIEILRGVLDEDRGRVLRGFFHMGFAAPGGNRALLERTVETYFRKLLRVKDRTAGALMRASTKELEALADPGIARDELRELMRSFEYPPGWFYIERAAVLLFWLCAQIDPELDTLQVGVPYVMALLREPSEATLFVAPSA